MNKDKPGLKRLLLLGNVTQVHLQRWAAYFLAVDCDVVTLSLETGSNFPGRFEHIRVPGVLPGFIRYPLAVPRVKDIISTFQPDLINAHFLPNYGVIAALINRRPWIFSSWGSDIMLLPERSLFHMKRTRYVLNRASFITSDADIMTKRLVELGVAPGRVLTVPFGVDTDAFYIQTPGPVDDTPRLLSCRKLEKLYNVQTVIEAFISIKARLPEARLTIAGEGSLKGQLIEQAEASSYRDDILFVGDVDHTKIPALLREHNIYISSALSDTTSVSLLEAIACGLFPIVTNIPANREWIVAGTNGLLFTPGDPADLARTAVEAWENPALRLKAREHNLGLIREKANWQDNMGLVKGLFESILEEKSTPSS